MCPLALVAIVTSGVGLLSTITDVLKPSVEALEVLNLMKWISIAQRSIPLAFLFEEGHRAKNLVRTDVSLESFIYLCCHRSYVSLTAFRFKERLGDWRQFYWKHVG